VSFAAIIAIQSATLKSSGFLPNSKKGARSAASRDQKNSQFNRGCVRGMLLEIRLLMATQNDGAKIRNFKGFSIQ
jgi:hypothetical protein